MITYIRLWRIGKKEAVFAVEDHTSENNRVKWCHLCCLVHHFVSLQWFGHHSRRGIEWDGSSEGIRVSSAAGKTFPTRTFSPRTRRLVFNDGKAIRCEDYVHSFSVRLCRLRTRFPPLRFLKPSNFPEAGPVSYRRHAFLEVPDPFSDFSPTGTVWFEVFEVENPTGQRMENCSLAGRENVYEREDRARNR